MRIYLHRNGKDFGPYSPEQVQNMVNLGTVQPTDLAWHELLTDWQAVASVIQLEERMVEEEIIPQLQSPPPEPKGRKERKPRRVKPPGYEKWTWDEINLGHKMSKGGKRVRRLAMSLGATKDSSGNIVPPKFNDNPGYYFVLVLLLIMMIASAIFVKN